MLTALPLTLLSFLACDFSEPAGQETAPPVDTAGPAPVDADGDGWVEPVDCDDTDPEVHPEAEEVCNGLDDDCDGNIDVGAVDAPTWYADADADGYGDAASATAACSVPSGFVSDPADCDDSDPAIHPDAEELCNGLDDDCDGTTDEDVLQSFYGDEDGDGYGNLETPLEACAPPTGFVAGAEDGVAFDCDDGEPAIHPGAEERCDGRDDDCDGSVDEDDAVDAPTWHADADEDGYGDAGATAVACAAPSGYLADANDCDDADPDIHPSAAERCDGLDNDCDGLVDEELLGTWYADLDGDGYGDPASALLTCDPATGWVADSTDCDDTDPGANPGQDELCDGTDDDCDGSVDEDDAVDAGTWYTDGDADGYGVTASARAACAQPHGASDLDGDCDDTDAAVNPGAKESCNGVDDDCNGAVDDGVLGTWYTDGDGDGYGDPASSTEACTAPSGTVADGTDCDDGAWTTHPGAEEICGDGLDNDCDGLVDEGGDTSSPEDTDPGEDTGDPCADFSACPADMVAVESCFCVDAHEASRPDASATSAGSDTSYAVSQAGVLPWQVSSNAEAATACTAAGKRLCSEEEWYQACAGPSETVYTYGDAYDAAACNGLDTHCGCADGSVYEDCFFDCGGSFYLLPTGSLSACTNGYGVYDMSGNLWEHVDGGSAATVRGGAYNCGDTPSFHRCTYIPTTWTPSARGFRCCSDGT